MKNIIKQGLVAVSAATMMISATSVAQATQPGPVAQEPSADCCSMDASECSSCNSTSVWYAMEHLQYELGLLELIENLNVEDVALVNVEKALNGDILDLLNFYQSTVLNDVNVGLLQDILSNVITVAAGDDVIEISEFLNGNDIDIGDIVALDVLANNQVVFFYW
ncbi:hypothetical protein [Chondromyces apiculatus]|uniref:Uncharacterized protein n=1 Tax=Chondromyces apiculatus DSM 436 TaxID=1192034 RepID=A0A017SWY9_9BACT|nr:hypothetical protein [Chondromyces apiculatus]EYF01100.1 Hypothetical protein CAP_8605 [Chondromyces apiculatus DSM 436]